MPIVEPGLQQKLVTFFAQFDTPTQQHLSQVLASELNQLQNDVENLTANGEQTLQSVNHKYFGVCRYLAIPAKPIVQEKMTLLANINALQSSLQEVAREI
ncbi:hypothetical protein [Shewanella waksmanii]|uniref:hypothetical protein n=1 Tax=Shewanella waksmanii TaxID=213783 RepID=UPI003736B156